jgi:hypothetical protein
MITLDEMLTRGSAADYLAVEAMILSGQIDEARVASVLASYPTFAAWLAARDAQRNRE